MKEALKLALEALQLVSIEFVCNGAHHAKKDRHDWLESCPIVERYQAAITAIKEALAQPEQEPVATTYKEVTDAMNLLLNGDYKQVQMAQLMADAKLYTAPPKRPWVGLTDEFYITNMFDMGHYSLQIVFKSRKNADEFKAALQEKNT